MWQTASDFLIFLGWLWQNATAILEKVFLPVSYIFTFLRAFFEGIFTAVPAGDAIYTFDNSIVGVFNTIPYFSTYLSAIFIAITGVMIGFILNQITKV